MKPHGPVFQYLADDHARLDALLRDSVAPPDGVDMAPYATFRAGLLRHIGLEEKILLPAARRARGGEPLPAAAALRKEHAALAALLVPTPTREILETIRSVLEGHNAIEEDPGGVYETCEQILASDLDAIAAKLEAAPAVPTAPHFDGPRVREQITALLAAARTR